MKKLIIVMCVLIAAIPMLSTAASAAQVDIPAVAVYADGVFAADKAPSSAEIEALDGYELYIDGESVLSVGARSIELAGTGIEAPTFYSAEFFIPETTLKVFLAGLGSDDIEELQEAIIENIADGAAFDIIDLSFIDAEKTYVEDGDENLCWAASASNLLYYTGWAALAGFSDEDELFDLFVDNFTDDGLDLGSAFAWFFNGAALRDSDTGGARIKDYPDSGAYLKDYAYDMISGYNYLSLPDEFNAMYELLRNGWGLSPGIDLYDEFGNYFGSHAITLWGMVVDESLNPDDPERYKGIFDTDSDSHVVYDGDRREADNVLSYYPMYYSEDDDCFCFYLPESELTAVFYDLEVIMPYGDELKHETDPEATRDKTSYPDIVLYDAFITDEEELYYRDLFETGSEVRFGYSLASAADKAWDPDLVTDITVVSSTGEELFSYTDSYYIIGGMVYDQFTDLEFFSVYDVPAGDYTLTFTVNPDRDYAEAYYYNNSVSLEFRVRDSYIIGDYDGSGAVDLLDVTALQYSLAHPDIEIDAKALERGDIDSEGLDITDATWIQRSIAQIDIPYTIIGENSLHTMI